MLKKNLSKLYLHIWFKAKKNNKKCTPSAHKLKKAVLAVLKNDRFYIKKGKGLKKNEFYQSTIKKAGFEWKKSGIMKISQAKYR